MILDQAHYIKNNTIASSKIFKSLNYYNFILMNGTPVQNHISKLVNLLDFITKDLFIKIRSEFSIDSYKEHKNYSLVYNF